MSTLAFGAAPESQDGSSTSLELGDIANSGAFPPGGVKSPRYTSPPPCLHSSMPLLGAVCVVGKVIHDSCCMLRSLDMHRVSGLAWSILSAGTGPRRRAPQHLSALSARSASKANHHPGEAPSLTKEGGALPLKAPAEASSTAANAH